MFRTQIHPKRFSRTVQNLLVPAPPAGYKFWYPAGYGLYSDAGITPAANDGATAQWNDQSVNALHLSASGGSATKRANQLNGYAGVDFNGAALFQNTALNNQDGQLTIFVVAKLGAASGTPAIFGIISGANTVNALLEAQAGSFYPRFRHGATSATPASDHPLSSFQCWMGRIDDAGNTLDIQALGGALVSVADATASSGVTKLWMGSGNMIVVEGIGYGRAMSDVDKDAVFAYFSGKFGL